MTGASKEPVLAEGDYTDVIALVGMKATWEPKFKMSCQSPRLYITVFPGHAPVYMSTCLLDQESSHLTQMHKHKATHQAIHFSILTTEKFSVTFVVIK